MKIITDFNKAKLLLNRELYVEDSLQPQGTRNNERTIEEIVRDIIVQVRLKGDKALYDYTKKFDKVILNSLEISQEEIIAAYNDVDKKLIKALELSASRIRKFHEICKQGIKDGFLQNGVGRQTRPLEKVGIYVPGGTASYPSTVLMTAIPASIAGVNNIVMVTPCNKEGSIPKVTLAAARIAGVNRIFKVGGAQAIAALAYGTKSIPKVDKICGPGNIFVATAKKLVFGVVDIDGIQGPSEVLILTDESANPVYCAADLIAQSEHDTLASAVLITTSKDMATKINKEITAQLKKLDRRKIAAESLNSRGIIVVVDKFKQAIELANLFAPEHLLIMAKNAKKYSNQLINSGCICISETSPVALGDYIAGPSHVLPTGGTARFSSPLSVEDFIKYTSIININKQDQEQISKAAIIIAEAEGLTGHAQAMRLRLKKKLS